PTAPAPPMWLYHRIMALSLSSGQHADRRPPPIVETILIQTQTITQAGQAGSARPAQPQAQLAAQAAQLVLLSGGQHAELGGDAGRVLREQLADEPAALVGQVHRDAAAVLRAALAADEATLLQVVDHQRDVAGAAQQLGRQVALRRRAEVVQ